METTDPISGQKTSLKQPPSGLRRLTLGMLATERLAENFYGLSGEGRGGEADPPEPGRVLAAFKAASPYLGVGSRVVQAIDWLFRFTQAQD